MISVGNQSEWTPSVFALQDKLNTVQQQISMLILELAKLKSGTNKARFAVE